MGSTENHVCGAATRFAPSPTGYLHLGHAYAALFAEAAARAEGGRFIVRMEDIDVGRCRPSFDAAILDDLGWLGLSWDEPIRRQSEHLDDYATALDEMRHLGLLYPCFCTRKDIQAEIAAAGQAPHGPDGPLYPGTCRTLSPGERERRINEESPFALRLDMEKATALTGALTWHLPGGDPIKARPQVFGDVVLARKDVPTSYHLAVTVDDHLQGITVVTRGEDLYQATHVHRLLQALLGLKTPLYEHHRLLVGETGRRLAKRDQGLTLRALRQSGKSPAEVRRMVGYD
ncbi:MAG: tRNA glutamyl-Q(34) synthetase GluQRS [Rhodospirillales bacterium]|jgi:glutamyl-Q tRNA(Asp) synthetase|nr:tRNA glutamyl-Q(34) synthetase GluQRS [Rhodospirillales bacterium]HJO96456.1 tRNA glutamyl-Q(34) synthetase GluQRS [Rhodospirillales bacterium]